MLYILISFLCFHRFISILFSCYIYYEFSCINCMKTRWNLELKGLAPLITQPSCKEGGIHDVNTYVCLPCSEPFSSRKGSGSTAS